MTDKSDDKVGHLNTFLPRGGGNLNDPIFKSSNARGLLFKTFLKFLSVNEILNQYQDNATRERCKRISSYFEAHYHTFFTNFTKKKLFR